METIVLFIYLQFFEELIDHHNKGFPLKSFIFLSFIDLEPDLAGIIEIKSLFKNFLNSNI